MYQPNVEYDEVKCPISGLDGPCHIFRGGKGTRGYGRIKINGKATLVHRYVWELANGSIPKRLVLDHRCRNHGCCNINHLRLVTNKINSTENVIGAQWQLNAAKTHCPHGHKYAPENTRQRPDKGRSCKQCGRIQKQARKKLKRALARATKKQ